MKYVKSIIGLDVNKLNVPVNINAPMSVLQIGAEANLVTHKMFADAYAHEESMMRMVRVAAGVILSMNQTFGRTAKPFNPMLGETYEYITKDHRSYYETVCHHPPIFALNVESDFYDINRVCQTT